MLLITFGTTNQLVLCKSFNHLPPYEELGECRMHSCASPSLGAIPSLITLLYLEQQT